MMHRSDRKYCSRACEAMAYRARRAAQAPELPGELTARRRWVRRSATKVPLTTSGRLASSTDPGTWSTYRQAEQSDIGDGMGFVLAAGDGIVCIDLDHCLAGSGLAGWAKPIVEQAAGTYVEVSPSGTGLHLWGRGEVARGRKIRRGDVAIEVYGRSRYIAMGHRYANAPLVLADLSDLVDSLG